jgi:hypothetical protein
MYQNVEDTYGTVRRMAKSRDGTKWFGSIKWTNPDTGKEEPMAIILPAEAIVRVLDEKAA